MATRANLNRAQQSVDDVFLAKNLSRKKFEKSSKKQQQSLK